MNPVFNGFSLQTDNIIIESIESKTVPNRNVNFQVISRRHGTKLTSTLFAERHIKMKGYVLADTYLDMRAQVDNLNQYVTSQDTGSLYLDSDRYAIATVYSIDIGDSHFNQSMVPVSIDFLLADPFFYGAQAQTKYTIASGTLSQQLSITISGSIFAEPTIAFQENGSSGKTTTSGITIQYNPTGETITASGTGGNSVFNYGDNISFDYKNYQILLNSSQVNVTGVFSQWQPGLTTFTISFSGSMQGGTLTVAYQPRYL